MSMGICGLRCIGVRRIRLLLELGLEEAGRWAGRLYGVCKIYEERLKDIQTLIRSLFRKVLLIMICYNGRIDIVVALSISIILTINFTFLP
jgi:hypothetical protein